MLYRAFRHERRGHSQVVKCAVKLARFIPAGLAIGIFSPLCVLLARSFIADQQSWEIAGQTTAIWRASDWILSAVVTVLYYHFLPILSRDALEQKISEAIWRVVRQIMLLSMLLLFALITYRDIVFQLLYNNQVQLSLEIALYFWVGEAARILSAIFLMGLFVLHATKLITIWDFFSQPLFVMLLFFGMSVSLELTGLAYLLTYLLYSALCIVGFMWVERKSRIA
jgi:hypothetical protein